MIYENHTDKSARRWWNGLSKEAKQRIGGIETHLYLSAEEIKRLYIATHK
jgi:hypothetical protein